MASFKYAEPPAAQTGKSSPAKSAQGQWLVERPEPGLARGRYSLPDWSVLLIGGVCVAIGLAYVFVKLRQALRK